HVPTTVLAQVDASIGGKTAVNTGAGKNMIGTIYHPNFVLCDTSMLQTLSGEAYYEGFAEIIKYALICDKELFEYLENTDIFQIRNNIATVITKCVKHKADIVAYDEADNNERLKLNFGHTIAHAIEKYYGYKIYSHPRAVGIGLYSTVLICENEGICKQGTAQRIKTLLKKFSLEYKMPQIASEDFYTIIANDKKFSSGGLKETVITDIGQSKIILLDDSKIKNIAEKYLKELK
ncbi:MAG: 3-dehydroquinate synthase, partial [Eubacteriaceae bacterium]|nr:3-dehydroquinate synthase [Eubacteriaceae bacterium]